MYARTAILTACLCCVATLLMPGAAQAQEQPRPQPHHHIDRGWFTYGLGVGAPFGLSGVVSADFGSKHIVELSLRSTTEFSIGGESDNVGAFSIAVGRSTVSRIGRLAATIGPALVLTDKYYPDISERKYTTTFGVMAAGQAIFTPIREAGLGLDAFVVLNPKQPAMGLSLTLAIEGYK